MANYWQIAAGSQGRDYSEYFIRFGMAFVGGKENADLMSEVKIGDRVLLKSGLSKLVAAGEVVNRDGEHSEEGDKEWLRDVDGWDLRAYCYVDWHIPAKPVGVEGLNRNTIQRVHKQQPQLKAAKVILDFPPQESIEPGPGKTEPVDDDEIIEHLIIQGLRPRAAEDLTTTFNQIRRLARYYRGRRWEDVREHETRTFLVIPLLLALGWAEQQIKIELPAGRRGRADVACFSKPYARKNGECVLIIETKSFSQGLHYAKIQVERYSKAFPNCKCIVASNGYCYKTWERQDDGQFNQMPSAYLNLLAPKDKYPLDPENVLGCLEVLRMLLPTTWM